MPWGIDQVDQVTSLWGTVSEELTVGDIVLVLVEEGNTGGLDGDTSLLLVFSGVGGSCETSRGLGDDSGLCDE